MTIIILFWIIIIIIDCKKNQLKRLITAYRL